MPIVSYSSLKNSQECIHSFCARISMILAKTSYIHAHFTKITLDFFFITDMYLCLYLHVHLRIDRPVLLTTNLSEHTFVCEIMQEYVRALIGVLSVYWLEFIFNCALFDNVLFFAYV